jgi:hypothetical protein
MRVFPSSNTVTVSEDRLTAPVSTGIGFGHRPATINATTETMISQGMIFRSKWRLERFGGFAHGAVVVCDE